jgi:hypothetical protein
MLEAQMEAAVERVMTLAQDECAPSKMTQDEAIEFYKLLSEECLQWVATIQGDIARETGEDE